MKHNYAFSISLALSFVFLSCQENNPKKSESVKATTVSTQKPPYNPENPKLALQAVAEAHGGWNNLWLKKDVQFTYNYEIPSENRADVSTERYIFDNEISYGKYNRHQINIIPKQEGEVVHLFNGDSTTVTLNKTVLKDPKIIAFSDFIRRANYFWFTMPYKLNNPGTIISHQGKESYNSINYDVFKVTYDPKLTGKIKNDIYLIYVNPETHLIDRFKFSLPFAGITEPVILTNYSYEQIDGQWIATHRDYFMPNTDGGYADEPTFIQTLSAISFNNGYTIENITQ
ncbi:DUF6503 family protein [Croceivirga sp. JEA036]|uniref:DUF6503 family protein n=1 Tax=Croceivirga sp. JEA036 TaxID=2721162 RepID=UPI00143B34A7|nr:DUF6503 family protein [Croceivirga sp. JEA036]NJB37379.1 hypothetical protein [Croceivirga sp. JEA036]